MFELIVNHVLGNIPTWIWPITSGIGAGVYSLFALLGSLPQVKPWAYIIKPASVIAVLSGVFMWGGSGVVAIYQEELKDANHRVELAESASKAATAQLATTLVNQENQVKGRAYGVGKVIETHRLVINANCNKINSTAWADYNRAVKNSASFVTVPAGAPK